MKICIITNGYPANGGDFRGAFARSFAIALKDLGHEVFIFTPERKGVEKAHQEMPISWFPWLGGERALVDLQFSHPSDAIKIFSLLKSGCSHVVEYCSKNSIDFCLSLWALPSGFFGYWAKKKLNIPYGVWCLGSDIHVYAKYPIIKNITKLVLKRADTLFADGIQLSHEVEELSKKKCDFLTTTRVLPKVHIVTFNVDKNYINYIFIGRLEKVKGVDILIEAMRLLSHRADACKIRLYIFGAGILEEFVRQKIQEYHLENFVFFLGYANQETISRYMQQCDWCVIPSRNDSIPVVFSEALQMNIPLIVADVGDMGFLVNKYGVGIVVKPEDSQNLSDAIGASANEDAAIRVRFIGNISILAKEFDIHEVAKNFIQKAEKIIRK